MIERYAFPLRYEAGEMDSAVNAFVLRSLFRDKPWRTLLPLALIVLSCGGMAIAGDTQLASLLFVAALFVLFIFVSAGWRMHRRAMREKVAAAQGKFCFARLYDEGIVIETGGSAPLVEWKSVTTLWPTEKVWLLILASNHFLALPIAHATREALDFLKARTVERPESEQAAPPNGHI